MNLFLKMRIKTNPNYINKLNKEELTEDIVSYAIDCGYSFDPTTIYRYLDFLCYKRHFNDTPAFKQKLIDDCKNNHGCSLGTLYHECFFRNIREFCNLLIQEPQLLTKLDLSEITSFSEDEKRQLFYMISKQVKPNCLDKTFLEESGILESYFQKRPIPLLGLMDSVDFYYLKNYENQFSQEILSHPDQYGNKIKEIENNFNQYDMTLYSEKFKQALINNYIRMKIPISDQVPDFILQDTDYQKMNIVLDPTLILKMKDPYYLFSREEATQIAKKIKEEKIVFEHPVPTNYLSYSSITDSITDNNPSLLADNEYLFNINLTHNSEELISLLTRNHYSLNQDTPSFLYNSDFTVLRTFLEKNFNFSQFVDAGIHLKKEEYQQIFDLFIKNGGDIRELEKSRFLQKNPYIVSYGIQHGFSPKKIDFTKVEYYRDVYHDIKIYGLRNNLKIPDPLFEDDLIRINNHKEVLVTLKDIDTVEEAITFMKERGIEDFSLRISLTNRLGFNCEDGLETIIQKNIDYFKNLKDSNISIFFSYGKENETTFTLDQVLKEEMFLQKCADEILKENFSPLEQYIAIFDIVKNFKPYKEEEENNFVSRTKSRGIYEILNNEYMVCVGYSNLINNLCSRVGIPCLVHSLQLKEGGHARNYVHLVDKKYGISGFYVSDATWDNKVKKERKGTLKESFDYLLLTTEEARKRVLNHNDTYLITETGGVPGKDTLINSGSLNKYISQLDPIFYEEFKRLDFQNPNDLEKYQAYIMKKINQPIDASTILNAIMEVKSRIYKNLSKNELNDLKMWYVRSNFWDNIHQKPTACSEEYEEYFLKRQNELLEKTFSQIRQENRLNDDWVLSNLFSTYAKSFPEENNLNWHNDAWYIISREEADYHKYLSQENQLKEQGLTCEFTHDGELFETTIRMPKLEKKEEMTVSEYLNLMTEQRLEFMNILSNNPKSQQVEARSIA